MDIFTDEKLENLVEFSAKSIADAQISVFKTHGYKYANVSEKSLIAKHSYLADYFNKCWKSLILQDDPIICDTFKKIHQNLPNESPLCIFVILLDISLDVMNDVPTIGSSTKKSQQVPQNTIYVNTLHAMLKQLYRDVLFLNFRIIFKPSHICPCPRLETLPSNEDPNEPLFAVIKKDSKKKSK